VQREPKAAVAMSALTTAARKIMYRWPQFLEHMPHALIRASRVAINSGRRAREALDKVPTHL
jgi:hypothetical protein